MSPVLPMLAMDHWYEFGLIDYVSVKLIEDLLSWQDETLCKLIRFKLENLPHRTATVLK